MGEDDKALLTLMGSVSTNTMQNMKYLLKHWCSKGFLMKLTCAEILSLNNQITGRSVLKGSTINFSVKKLISSRQHRDLIGDQTLLKKGEMQSNTRTAEKQSTFIKTHESKR